MAPSRPNHPDRKLQHQHIPGRVLDALEDPDGQRDSAALPLAAAAALGPLLAAVRVADL